MHAWCECTDDWQICYTEWIKCLWQHHSNLHLTLLCVCVCVFCKSLSHIHNTLGPPKALVSSLFHLSWPHSSLHLMFSLLFSPLRSDSPPPKTTPVWTPPHSLGQPRQLQPGNWKLLMSFIWGIHTFWTDRSLEHWTNGDTNVSSSRRVAGRAPPPPPPPGGTYDKRVK